MEEGQREGGRYTQPTGSDTHTHSLIIIKGDFSSFQDEIASNTPATWLLFAKSPTTGFLAKHNSLAYVAIINDVKPVLG